MHICYGYGIKANTDWKRRWAPSGDSMKRLSRSCRNRPLILSLECHNSRVPMDLLELIRGKR